MAKTFTNLQTQTRTYLDEATQDDWLDTEVKLEVNAGYHELVTAVMEVYEEYYVTTTTMDSVANQQEYTTADGFPSDLFKLRRVEINYEPSNSNSIPRRAKPVNIDAVNRDLGNSALGMSIFRNPGYYLLGSSTGSTGITLGFIPYPTEGGTGAIKIWYVPIVSDLSAGSDAINIPYPDRYGKLISLYAAAQLLRKGQQEEPAASAYMQEFEYGLTRMREQLEDRVSDDTKSVVDTVGMDLDFSSGSSI